MSDDQDPKLLDHNYDGIQELDNPLPNWWLMTFYGAIVFGVAYFAYYQIFDAPSLRDQYAETMSHHREVIDAYLENLSEFDEQKYESVMLQPEMLSYGRSLFDTNCVSCHAVGGAGDIGPNLTDQYWLFADGTAESIFPFLITGSPAAGMPAWGEYLEEDQLYAVLGYISSIQGTNPPDAKEPQGEYFGDEAPEEEDGE